MCVVVEWISPDFGPAGGALTALLAAVLLVAALRATPARIARLRARIAAEPGARLGQYRLAVLTQWVLAAIAIEVVELDPGVSYADLGLEFTGRDVAAALATGGLLALGMWAGLANAARQIRAGRGMPRGERLRAATSFLEPRTGRERCWAALLSVSAGICEELVFRGLLLAAGVGLLGLPVAVSALVVAAWFGLGHRYQGRAGMAGSAVIGLAMTLLYLASGSLLPAMAAHAVFDLLLLLWRPGLIARAVREAAAASKEASEEAAAPAATRIAAEAPAVAGPPVPRQPTLRSAVPTTPE